MHALYVCLHTPYVCALHVYLMCMPDTYALYVCLMCMPDMYALHVCLIRITYTCVCVI